MSHELSDRPSGLQNGANTLTLGQGMNNYKRMGSNLISNKICIESANKFVAFFHLMQFYVG